MCEMEARCGLTPSPKHAHAAQSVVKRGTFREIWAPQYRQRTLMLMVMNFFRDRFLRLWQLAAGAALRSGRQHHP